MPLEPSAIGIPQTSDYTTKRPGHPHPPSSNRLRGCRPPPGFAQDVCGGRSGESSAVGCSPAAGHMHGATTLCSLHFRSSNLSNEALILGRGDTSILYEKTPMHTHAESQARNS